MSYNLHFESKANRDREAARMRQNGLTVRKSSSRGIVLSPDYVQDFSGIKIAGLGGSTEPTLFGVVYNLEVVR